MLSLFSRRSLGLFKALTALLFSVQMYAHFPTPRLFWLIIFRWIPAFPSPASPPSSTL